jgi:hypothetical protein
MSDPIVEAAEVAPGHDGRAELVLVLRYPNGAQSRLRLEPEAGVLLVERAGLTSLGELVGRAWSGLASALKASAERAQHGGAERRPQGAAARARRG